MTEPNRPDEPLAELEAWLAAEWSNDEPPLDVEETTAVLRTLVDSCYVIRGVDAGTLFAAAERVQLDREKGTLEVLAGLAGHLHRGV
jgi:hypothetical protein